MTLLLTVERHLRRTDVPPSRFGRQVAGDPRFVFDLRKGREPRPAMCARVMAYIAAQQGRLGDRIGDRIADRIADRMGDVA